MKKAKYSEENPEVKETNETPETSQAPENTETTNRLQIRLLTKLK